MSIGNLDLANSLWMYRVAILCVMEYFAKRILNDFFAKVGTVITEYRPRESKARNNVSFQKSHHYFVIISSAWSCFYPLWYIIDSNRYVLMAKKKKKGSHEIDAPHIKIWTTKIRFSGIMFLRIVLPMRWHLSHEEQKMYASWNKVGQYKPHCKILEVIFLALKWSPQLVHGSMKGFFKIRSLGHIA